MAQEAAWASELQQQRFAGRMQQQAEFDRASEFAHLNYTERQHQTQSNNAAAARMQMAKMQRMQQAAKAQQAMGTMAGMAAMMQKQREAAQTGVNTAQSIISFYFIIFLLRDGITLLLNALTLFLFPLGTLITSIVTLPMLALYFRGLDQKVKEQVLKESLWSFMMATTFTSIFYLKTELRTKKKVRAEARANAQPAT